MKKIFTSLFITALVALTAYADEVTLNFVDLDLDNSATLTDHKINDNLSISSTGNASWNGSNKDFRLFSGGGFNVTIANATLTGVAITCNTNYGFGAFSTVTVDGDTDTNFEVTPVFSWTGEATESWAISAYPASSSVYNTRVESITFTYSPEAVAETKSVSVSCSEMGVEESASLPATGFDVDDYVNINFVQGSHNATPTYRSNKTFYIFNGQQVVVTAKNGATLKSIEIITNGSNFGYMGTVTADGTSLTYPTDFGWVPFKWEGSAEQNVTIQNGVSSGSAQVTGLTITYETPGAGVTVAKPVITASDTDNTVTITCDTPGAQIYYTLDGTVPTAENGNLYTDVITLTESCTVQAVAVLDGVSSSVATLDVVLKVVDSLASFLANGSENDIVKINCPITAITGVGSYLAIKDSQGNYGVIYNTNSSLNDALSVQNGTTWSYITARKHIYINKDFEVHFIMPVEVGEVSQGEAVEPTEMKLGVDGTEHGPFEYVVVKNVTVKNDPYYMNYMIFADQDGNEFEDAYKIFVITYPNDSDVDRYDVTGVVTPKDDEDWYQFLPLSFTKKETTGVELVDELVKEGTGVAEFYNLNGVRIDKPAKGVFIKLVDGKAEKVLVKE